MRTRHEQRRGKRSVEKSLEESGSGGGEGKKEKKKSPRPGLNRLRIDEDRLAEVSAKKKKRCSQTGGRGSSLLDERVLLDDRPGLLCGPSLFGDFGCTVKWLLANPPG